MLGRARRVDRVRDDAQRRRSAVNRPPVVLEFNRPLWQFVPAIFVLFFLPVTLPFTRWAIGRKRVWGEREPQPALVVEEWPWGGSVRVPPTDVIEIRRERRAITLVAARGPVPLVRGRRVHDGDVAQARVLAEALGVPFIDRGAGALPVARVVADAGAIHPRG